ncbi:LOW QUALITY PROTEIN: hypothetical protein V2J09_017351 [Rumex salicifolius]
MEEEIPQESPNYLSTAFSVSALVNWDQDTEEAADYIHITQNEFSYRKHKKQKEEDVAICNCKFDPSDDDSTCGEACLNVLTSTECTPGFCPCGVYCKNQKFQKCEYAKTKLVKTAGRGCGLLADENIKGGQFIIEYCGEVISWKEAKRRTLTYESQGIKDAYIIALNAYESIDATKKGISQIARHGSGLFWERYEWGYLQSMILLLERSWHMIIILNGMVVRCLCGAANCSGFLGAKSRGFQEDTYNWEDDDDRFSIEKIPLYDSAEDEPSSNLLDIEMIPTDAMNGHAQNSILQENAMGFQTPSGRNHAQSGTDPKKSLKPLRRGRPKNLSPKELDAKAVAQMLASKEAQNDILICEEMKIDASSNLESLYNEIRPAIEEHERDRQDNVPTSLAEKWIEASCSKMKAEFDLYFSIIKNVVCTPKRKLSEIDQPQENEVKLLTDS